MQRNWCFALGLGCALALPASAEITLRAKDSTFVINGTLLEFSGGIYTVETSLGTLNVDAALADCEGDCPSLEPEDKSVRVAFVDDINAALIPDLIAGYYDARDMGVAQGVAADGQVQLTVTGETGAVIGQTSIAVLSGAEAFAALRTGAVDLIFSNRRATNSEVEASLDAGQADLLDASAETIFGADAVVVAVSPDNPVRALTYAQAEGVFSGQITNWSELGGPDLPIMVYAPADETGVADTFRRLILDPAFADYAPEADRSRDAADIRAAVAIDPSAIGLTTLSRADAAIRSVSLVASCGIETRADRFSLLSENYPLSQRLYAYQNGGENILAQGMAQFAVSAAGQALLQPFDVVGTSPDVVDLARLGKQFVFGLTDPEGAAEIPNLQAFGREVLSAERLSTTFRFAPGSSQLDNKARADAQLLVELLQQPAYRGSEVLLVGFTDSIGASDVNKVLSERRAGQVLSEIAQAGGAGVDTNAFVSYGFGEAFPVACNDEDAGRDLNRRVEVWLR